MVGEIDTGLVHVNGPTVDDEPMAPFGGVGDSGFGRFGGQEGAGPGFRQRRYHCSFGTKKNSNLSRTNRG
jgi:acyl-CoA reductase-like NAD-dependent aldehyde dehydrogenase